MKRNLDLKAVLSVEAVVNIAPDGKIADSFSTLFRWKRSIYKLVWRHMVIYYIIYVLLTITHTFLNEAHKKDFEALAKYCSNYTSSINLMILLGFFTSTAMQRLFSIQTALPGTAKLTTVFICSLKTDLAEGPMIISQYSRWLLLSWIFTFRYICKPLRSVYPDMLALKNAGLLNEEEMKMLESKEFSGTPKPLICINWMLLLLKETWKEDRFSMERNYNRNVDALLAFKKSCGNTIKFASQNIPHALIQAVYCHSIIAVYCFGMITLMARNFSNEQNSSHVVSGYLPLMPGMQFFVYLAWLSFGRAAVNPFGDDEDDIDVKQLLQSHFETAAGLQKLCSCNLMDVFPNLPQAEFNQVTEQL